jgi:putative ABC transport system substrate-binding protein
MKRREVIRVLGGAAIVWPIAGRAQQKPRLPAIGFLGVASPSTWKNYVTVFEHRLSELGWIEGRSIAIEYRWADGQDLQFAEFAAEFVRLKVDVIVTAGSAVLAAKQATSVIPIVFAVASDPLGAGMVKSLSRPGGNVTGLSLQGTELAGKRLELLLEVLPGFRRLAVFGNTGYSAAALEMDEVEAKARSLSLEVVRAEVRRAEDIATTIAGLKQKADALYVCTDSLANAHQVQINRLAIGARLPAMLGAKVNVETGGLMSYGPSYLDLFRRAADYVDKILRGAKPGDLPVEQPTKFELIINLKTANALGLELPSTLLARADEVIE